MTDNCRNIWGVSLSILAFSFAASTASAQTCSSQPTCKELGYVYGASDCKDIPTLTCPFDSYYKYCASPSCPEGYTRNETPWADAIGACTGSRNTTCKICGEGPTDGSSLVSELINKCPKENDLNVFEQSLGKIGNYDIPGYAGAGHYDAAQGNQIIILSGPYCGANEAFVSTTNNSGYITVDVGPYATYCNSNNSTFNNKFMDINLNGSSTSAEQKTIGTGDFIAITIQKGKIVSVIKESCDNMNGGSAVQAYIYDFKWM